MITLRLAIMTRRIGMLFVAVVLLSALAFATSSSAISVSLSQINPPHEIPDPELISLLTGIIAAGILRSRFWEWEHLGGWRVRIIAALTTLVGLASLQVPVLVAVTRLPASVHWIGLISNALTVGGCAFILSAVVGPAVGAGLTLLAYFAYAITDNLVRTAAPYLPLADVASGANPVWLPAIVLSSLAIIVNGCTFGATTWAHQLVHNG